MMKGMNLDMLDDQWNRNNSIYTYPISTFTGMSNYIPKYIKTDIDITDEFLKQFIETEEDKMKNYISCYRKSHCQ